MSSPNPLVTELGDTHVLKAGVLRKRSGRMHQWTSRFFVLSDSKISYKLKADAPQFKCSYDLSAGCIVTEVNVESRIQGKRLYSFWIVWPHDKSKDDTPALTHTHNGNDSDDELTLSRENTLDESTHASVAASVAVSAAQTGKTKDLKQIVESEVMTMKRQRTLVEQQVELHTAADNNVSLGAKVAAVAVGGVVVGALTAGIGLIPYLTVVGITAAAGGGAVAWQWRYRKPLDSRLIMACESMQEAIEWKTAIEAQIQRIDCTLKPSPPSVNSKVIASIFDRDSLGGTWRRVCVCEQMIVYEHVLPYALNNRGSGSGCPAKCGVFGASSSLIGLSAGCEDAVCGVWADSAVACERPTDPDEDSLKNAQMTRCRRAQLVIPCHPLNAFLSLMNAGLWPHKGSFKPVRQINDHADVVGVEMDTPCALYGGAKSVRRRFALSRFWSLDDDGVYLITLNSVQCDEFPCEVKKGSSSSFKSIPFEQSPSIAAVLSISPRSDCSHSSYAHSALADEECLCVVHCQASCAHWEKGEQTGFLMSFIKDHLLELQHSVCVGKYFTIAGDELRQELSTVSAHASAASAASVATTLSEREITKHVSSLESSSAPSTRRAKRGVTTTQPGLEDALSLSQSTHSSHPIPIAHAVQAPSPTTIPHSERDVQRESDREPEPPMMLERSPASSVMGKSKSSSRLGLFNRKKSPPFDEKEKEKPTLSPTKSDLSSSQKDGGGVIGTVRNQIAATEEELHRLAKTMKKKVIVSPSYVAHSQTRVDKHQVTPTEYSAIQDAQSELQRKLQQLRQRHVALTGETYEQFKAAQKQSLSRYLSVTGKRENSINSSGNNNNNNNNNNNANANARAFASPIIEEVVAVGNEKEQEKTNRKVRARPAHWVTVHRVAKSKSWIVFLPSLLVSLLQPSFWQRVLHTLTLEREEEQDDTRGIQWSSAVRDAQSREAALVVLSLFAALLVATHIFADTLSGIFALIKVAF